MLVLASNKRTWEVQAGGSKVQGHPQLDNELEDSLDYVRPCFINNKQANKQKTNKRTIKPQCDLCSQSVDRLFCYMQKGRCSIFLSYCEHHTRSQEAQHAAIISYYLYITSNWQNIKNAYKDKIPWVQFY